MLQMGAGRRCRLYAAAFGGPERSLGRFIAAGGGEGANEVKVNALLPATKSIVAIVAVIWECMRARSRTHRIPMHDHNLLA